MSGEYHAATDTVVLNSAVRNVEKLMGYVMGHETAHSVEGTKQMEALKKLAVRSMGAEGWAKAQADVREEYAAAGTTLSSTDVEREALADWVGNNLFKKGFVQAVVSGDATTGNTLLYLLDRVRRVFATKNSLSRNVAMLERLFMQAIEARDTRTVTDGEGVQGAVNGAPVIDLSDHSELAKRVEGAPKGKKNEVIQQYILEALGTEPFRLSDGKMAVVDRSDARHIANFARSEMEVAQVAEIKTLVENALLYTDAPADGHNKFDHFWYYEAVVRYGNDEYSVFLNVGRTINDRTYHLYDIKTENKRHRRLNKQPQRPKPNEGYALRSGVSTTTVAQNDSGVNTQSMPEGARVFTGDGGNGVQGALLTPDMLVDSRGDGSGGVVAEGAEQSPSHGETVTAPFTQGGRAADAANGADGSVGVDTSGGVEDVAPYGADSGIDVSIDEGAVLEEAVRRQAQGKRVVEVDVSAIKDVEDVEDVAPYIDRLERELGSEELLWRMCTASRIDRPTGTVEVDGTQVSADAYMDAYQRSLPDDVVAVERHIEQLESARAEHIAQMQLDGTIEGYQYGGLKIDLQLFAAECKRELLMLDAGENGKKKRQFYEKRLLGNDANHCQELIQLLSGHSETYNPIGNQRTLDAAKSALTDAKYQAKLRRRLYRRNSRDLFTAQEVAAATVMINNAINDMDYNEAANLITGLSRKGTEAGRAVQAFSMMARLTPEGVLKTAVRYMKADVDRMICDGAADGIHTIAKKIARAIKEAEAEGVSSDEIAERIRNGEDESLRVTAGESAVSEKNKANETLAYILASKVDAIKDMNPVATLTGTEFNDRSKKLSEQIADFFRSLGNKVTRNRFGNVLLDDYGVRSTIAHKPVNRARIVSVAAVPAVIENGRQIGGGTNWKGRGYDSYIFAAPVVVGDTTVYVAAVVNKHADNKFYLSEMVDSDGNYVRIEESPSGNSKYGVTDGADNSAGPGSPPRPEGLSEAGDPSAETEPTPDLNTNVAHDEEKVKGDVPARRKELVEALTDDLAATEGTYLTREAVKSIVHSAIYRCTNIPEQLKRYVLKQIRKDDGALAQRIYEVYKKGHLSVADYQRALEEALGLPTLTEEPRTDCTQPQKQQAVPSVRPAALGWGFRRGRIFPCRRRRPTGTPRWCA